MKTINRTLILLLGIMVSTCFAADIIGPLLHEVKVPCNAMGFASIAGKYYAAWTPSDHSAVHFMYSDDGANFKESAVTPTDGYGGASIAAYQGHLYLAFHGGDANHSLNIVEVRLDAAGHPTGVGGIITSVQSSDVPPLLVSTEKGLFIEWFGRGNGHVCIARVNVP